MNALALAIQLLQSIVSVVPLAQEVKAIYDGWIGKLQTYADNGTDPTPEDWDALNADLDAAGAKLLAP
jgi:hypothetical protein